MRCWPALQTSYFIIRYGLFAPAILNYATFDSWTKIGVWTLKLKLSAIMSTRIFESPLKFASNSVVSHFLGIPAHGCCFPIPFYGDIAEKPIPRTQRKETNNEIRGYKMNSYKSSVNTITKHMQKNLIYIVILREDRRYLNSHLFMQKLTVIKPSTIKNSRKRLGGCNQRRGF